MADKKNAEAAAEKAEQAAAEHSATVGVSADAEKIDTPLAVAGTVGPRDALLEPRETDIVPDLEEKGYHVGMVRQPADVVGVRGVPQGFRSATDMPSRFPSFREVKAAHNEREASQGDSFGVPASPDPGANVTPESAKAGAAPKA